MIWTILGFKDDSRFKDFNGVPLSLWYLNAINSLFCVKVDSCYFTSIVIEINFIHATTEQHHCFRGVIMTMNRQFSAWHEGIQHTLRLVHFRVPQIEILAESWT